MRDIKIIKMQNTIKTTCIRERSVTVLLENTHPVNT